MVIFHGSNSYADQILASHKDIINKLGKDKNNFAILSVEYSSYLPKTETQISRTKPSQKSIEQDALSTYNYLTQKQNINPKNLTFYGESLGSYPTLFLASKGKTANKFIVNCPVASTKQKILHPTPNRIINILLFPISLLLYCITYPFADKLDNKSNIKEASKHGQNIEIIADKKDIILPPRNHAKLLKPYASKYTKLKNSQSTSGFHHTGTATIESLYQEHLSDILETNKNSPTTESSLQQTKSHTQALLSTRNKTQNASIQQGL